MKPPFVLRRYQIMQLFTDGIHSVVDLNAFAYRLHFARELVVVESVTDRLVQLLLRASESIQTISKIGVHQTLSIVGLIRK